MAAMIGLPHQGLSEPTTPRLGSPCRATTPRSGDIHGTVERREDCGGARGGARWGVVGACDGAR